MNVKNNTKKKIIQMETKRVSNIIEIPELDYIKLDTPFNEQSGMVQEFNLFKRCSTTNLPYNELPEPKQEMLKNYFISIIRDRCEKYYSISENFRDDYIIYICRGYFKK